MYIVPPSVIVHGVRPEEEILDFLELFGRTNNFTDCKDSKVYITKCMNNGNYNILEHYSITITIACSLRIATQLTRHRLASFIQESSTACDYSSERFGKALTFVRPITTPAVNTGVYTSVEDYKEKTHYKDSSLLPSVDIQWVSAMINAEKEYFELTAFNHEIATEILPMATKTTVVSTMNIRQWRYVIRKRISLQCHPAMREVMGLVLITLHNEYPTLFHSLTGRVE